MYRPPYTKVSETDARARELMERHPFATVVLVDPRSGVPEINHLPLLLDGPAGLLGHVARGNPLWRILSASPGIAATAVFHGPHGYISPSLYADPVENVPTWNYATVHATGALAAVDDEALEDMLARLVNRFEADAVRPWDYALVPDGFRRELRSAIGGFRLSIAKCEAKFKLSQNRDASDYAGVLRGLGERKDERSQELLALMRSSPPQG